MTLLSVAAERQIDAGGLERPTDPEKIEGVDDDGSADATGYVLGSIGRPNGLCYRTA